MHYQQKDFLSNCTSPCLQKNISQNVRLEHLNANPSQSSYHTHRYSAGRDCQIASLNGILRVENYHIARYLSTDQFFTIVVFFERLKFCHGVVRSEYLFLEVRCLIDLILQKYHGDTLTKSGKLHPQK